MDIEVISTEICLSWMSKSQKKNSKISEKKNFSKFFFQKIQQFFSNYKANFSPNINIKGNSENEKNEYESSEVLRGKKTG